MLNSWMNRALDREAQQSLSVASSPIFTVGETSVGGRNRMIGKAEAEFDARAAAPAPRDAGAQFPEAIISPCGT